jgi:hypothetical protein
VQESNGYQNNHIDPGKCAFDSAQVMEPGGDQEEINEGHEIDAAVKPPSP